ncbi:MAG: hypothetical protein ACUVS6_09285 [Anaerolineae bacterium]
MARAIRESKVTPADELRDLLTRNEKRVVNLRGQAAEALALLLDLDRMAELWPELAAQGVDLRPEEGRWETLQALVRRYAPTVVRELRSMGGLPTLRAQHHPRGEAAWWWFLAEELRTRRARNLTRTALALGGVVGAAALIYFLIFEVFFPVDPALKAALEAQAAAESKITERGDYVGALADFERAAQHRPGDPDTWLRVGCTLYRLGNMAAAQDNFYRAQVLLADPVEFKLARAPICAQLGVEQIAETDLQEVIAADPENAAAYYYLSTILETRGELLQALLAVQRAAELAESQRETELTALARFRTAVLMQQLAVQGIITATPPP